MKNHTTDTDRIIERIDQELLCLYYTSKQKDDYKFFDFYGAFQAFNESALKEGRREEYFKLKRDRYEIVFRDLMTNLPENHHLRRIENEQGGFRYREDSLTHYELLTDDCKMIFPPDYNEMDYFSPVDKMIFCDRFLDFRFPMRAMLFYFENYFLEVTPQDDDDDFLSFEKYIEDLQFQRELVLENGESNPGIDASVNMTLSKKSESATSGILTLETVFSDGYKYNHIMQILVERELCQAGTFIWINFKKGYKNLIVSLLKYLYFQNYYKSKTVVSNDQIRQIALNTFHVNISIDTIKHAEIDHYKLDFIPEASTIKENRLKIASGIH